MISRIGLLALLAVTRLSVADSPPNIVLIISDNQSQSLLGTYGKLRSIEAGMDRVLEVLRKHAPEQPIE